MAYGRLSHARGPTGRLSPIYILNHQISLPTLNRLVDSAVRPLVCSRIYTMHQNPSHGFARMQNVIGANLRNTVNPEKLSSMVMRDKKKEYIHHTLHLSNTSLPYNTISKTTN